jgi:hypothetical protein
VVGKYLSGTSLFPDPTPTSALFRIAALDEDGGILRHRIVRSKIGRTEQKLRVIRKVVG